MSSQSSLLTTAASDTSSSADSRYISGGARRSTLEYPTREATSILPQWLSSIMPVHSFPAPQSPRRRAYNLNARGVVIAKTPTPSGANQKVFCVCRGCKGQRLVSRSTYYRHLRVEAEIEEDDVKWDCARPGAQKNHVTPSHQEGSRMFGLGNHPPSIPVGFRSSQLVQ